MFLISDLEEKDMNYLKKLFSDKNVKIALIIILISFIALCVGVKLIKNGSIRFMVEIGCMMAMFSQFPTISNKAVEAYNEAEAEEMAKKPKVQHKKKK